MKPFTLLGFIQCLISPSVPVAELYGLGPLNTVAVGSNSVRGMYICHRFSVLFCPAGLVIGRFPVQEESSQISKRFRVS
jgi:hypothetical protein